MRAFAQDVSFNDREFLKSTERNVRIAINIALARSEWVLRAGPTHLFAFQNVLARVRTKSRES